MQQVLDTALEQASQPIKTRFALLVGDAAGAESAASADAGPREGVAADVELQLSTDPSTCSALDQLDKYAGWEPGTARQRVASRLTRLDVRHLQDRASRRRRIDQRRIAETLSKHLLPGPDQRPRSLPRPLRPRHRDHNQCPHSSRLAGP